MDLSLWLLHIQQYILSPTYIGGGKKMCDNCTVPQYIVDLDKEIQENMDKVAQHITELAKAEVKAKYGNKKRHRQ